MPSKHSHAPEAAAPPGADDFKLIHGIGPGIAGRLYGAGILTFAQLAALSPDEITAIVAGLANLSAKRVAKEQWIDQAQTLAAVPPPDPLASKEQSIDQAQTLATEPPPDLPASAGRQHYATFTVELLLDEDNDVRRTRVTHVQREVKDTWAGWREDKLVEFFIRSAALRVPSAAPAPVIPTVVESTPVLAEATSPDPIVSMRALEPVPAGADDPHSFLRDGQPFDIRLILDLADTRTPSEPLAYTAVVHAKSLNGCPRQIVGEARGTIAPADRIAIIVKGTALPRGIYRLEAAVALTFPASAPAPSDELTALLEGNLLLVY